MGYLNDFAFKQRKYMPVFPKATGKPTIYIEGYPYEDDEPMNGSRAKTAPSATRSSLGQRYLIEHITNKNY